MSGYSRSEHGYALTYSECFWVHEHGSWDHARGGYRSGVYCACSPCAHRLTLGSDDVFGHALTAHLVPAGFERLPHKSEAVLLLLGPGIQVGTRARYGRCSD